MCITNINLLNCYEQMIPIFKSEITSILAYDLSSKEHEGHQ